MTRGQFLKGAVVVAMMAQGSVTIATPRKARCLAEELGIPLYYHVRSGHDLWKQIPSLHTAILVNGPMRFIWAGNPTKKDPKCFAGALERIAERVPNIVWVQTDYENRPPGGAEGARSAFRRQWSEHKVVPHYWSIVEKNSTKTEGSAYINWNLTVYRPDLALSRTRAFGHRLLYYGRYRHRRHESFEQFLGSGVTVSTSKARVFQSMFPRIEVIPPFTDDLYATIHQYGAGIYMKDRVAHQEYPANRFYEMLSARLPMIFEEPSVKSLKLAGYDVASFACANLRGAKRLFRDRDKILRAQQRWHRDYAKEWRYQVWAAVDKLRRVI